MIGAPTEHLIETILATIGAIVTAVGTRKKMASSASKRTEQKQTADSNTDRDDAVAELKRQARANEDRIADLERRNAELERALEREREERADDNHRHAREIANLNRQLQTVLEDLAYSRQRPQNPPPTPEIP